MRKSKKYRPLDDLKNAKFVNEGLIFTTIFLVHFL